MEYVRKSTPNIGQRRRPRGPRALRFALAGLVGLTLLAHGSSVFSQGRAAKVTVDEVRQEDMHQTIPVIGRAVAREGGVVAARVAGAVNELRVHVGDLVKTGEVLAVLDESTRRAELERHTAEMALQRARLGTARANVDLMKQSLKRLAALKGSAASKASYDDKRQEMVRGESEVAERRAEFARAAANETMLKIALKDSTIRASYPGVIVQRHTSPGAYLRPGDPVVTMVNTEDMELEVDVPTARLGGLTQGASVRVELTDGVTVTAKVRAVVPDENPRTRTRSVRLSTATADKSIALASNQAVTVHVPVGEPRTVTSVHKDAVLNRRGQSLVYVVADATATPRQVQLGEAIGTRFEVRSGLKVGEQVVVRGNERLRPGQKVSPQSGS